MEVTPKHANQVEIDTTTSKGRGRSNSIRETRCMVYIYTVYIYIYITKILKTNKENAETIRPFLRKLYANGNKNKGKKENVNTSRIIICTMEEFIHPPVNEQAAIYA